MLYIPTMLSLLLYTIYVFFLKKEKNIKKYFYVGFYNHSYTFSLVFWLFSLLPMNTNNHLVSLSFGQRTFSTILFFRAGRLATTISIFVYQGVFILSLSKYISFFQNFEYVVIIVSLNFIVSKVNQPLIICFCVSWVIFLLLPSKWSYFCLPAVWLWSA